MNQAWAAILDAMARAREIRRSGGDPGALLDHVESLRAAADRPPGHDALLDLVAAAARGPLVIGQLGQTLDGKIATDNGHSHYVNGPVALDHLHRLRALVDAVVIGSGTLHEDDPALTVRRCSGGNPARVVIAGRRDLPSDRRIFRDGAAATLVAGVDLPVAPDPDGTIDPRGVLEALAALNLDVVLVEGGAHTVSRFLAAGCFDRMHLLVAPTLLGSGRSSFALDAVTSIDQALRFTLSIHPLGSDFLFDLKPDRGATLS